MLAAVFAIPLPPRATLQRPLSGGIEPDSEHAHDASGSAAAGKIISWTMRMAGSRGQPRSGKLRPVCRRDLRGVRKMPVFHQLSEQIWRDIVASV
jgi:hypothetical protein